MVCYIANQLRCYESEKFTCNEMSGIKGDNVVGTKMKLSMGNMVSYNMTMDVLFLIIM